MMKMTLTFAGKPSHARNSGGSVVSNKGYSFLMPNEDLPSAFAVEGLSALCKSNL
jgi:hypothetical protein